MIIAGPNGLQKLFAAPARQPAAVTTTQPAPATAPTEAPATATPATEAPAATTPAPATGTTTGPDGATTAPGTTATPSPAPAPGGEAAVTAPSPSQPASAAAVKTEAKGEAVTLPFGKAAYIPLMIVLVSALIALAFGFYWWRKTVAHDRSITHTLLVPRGSVPDIAPAALVNESIVRVHVYAYPPDNRP